MLVTAELIRMTPPERLTLITELWESLDHEQLPLTKPQEAELERRLASLDQDLSQAISWPELKAELEQRCP